MSLALLAFAFGFGLLLGGPGLVLLRRLRPAGEARRQRLQAALLAPLILLALCLLAAAAELADGWEANEDLVLATLATVAVTGGGLALAGGLLGAALMARRMSR